MKTLASYFILILAATAASVTVQAQPAAATAPQPKPLLQLHLAGLARIETNAEATTLKTILALPETRELLKVVLDKLATVPYRLCQSNLPAATPDRADLIRPLLEDWVRAESWVEWRTSGDHHQWALAVQLNDSQSVRWSTNLWQVTSQWRSGSPIPLKIPGLEGWETPPKAGSSAIQFVRRKDWILLVCGDPAAAWAQALRTKLAQAGRPVPELKDHFLDLTIDTPALGHRFPLFKELGLPPMQCLIQGDGEYVRTKALWKFPAPLDLNLRPWNIPTNFIYNPNNTLVSFTLARGIEPLLKSIKGIEPFGKQPWPDQVCSWGQSQFFGQTLVAIPLADPLAAMTALAAHLPQWSTNIFGSHTGSFFLNTNKPDLVWRGLPLIVPFAKPIVDHDQPFLLAGLAPMVGLTNPAPAEMFSHMSGKPRLVYYDWEITGPRYAHNGQFFQLGLALAKRRTLSTNAVTFRWGQKIHPLLGNSITELSHSSPTELDLIRKSHLGLTGVELIALSRWIDSPEFPLGISLPETLASMFKNRPKPADKDANPKKTP